MLKEKLRELYKILMKNEEKVLIHCSAGIHRTGTIAYTLLRMDGREPLIAWEGLKEMRM